MGKGGYNGGSTLIRTYGGHVPRQKVRSTTQKPKTTPASRRKAAQRRALKSEEIVTLAQARKLRLSRKEWADRCEKNIGIIEDRMVSCRREIAKLADELKVLRTQLRENEGQRRKLSGTEDEDKAH